MLGRPQQAIADRPGEPEQFFEQLVGLVPLTGHPVVDGQTDQRGVQGGFVLAGSALAQDAPEGLSAPAEPVHEEGRVGDHHDVAWIDDAGQRADRSIEASQSCRGDASRIGIERAAQRHDLGEHRFRAG